MSSRRPITLYLDHGDLSAIADGKVTEVVEDLRATISECNVHVLVSSAHILDLGRADDGTRARWIDALLSLGTIRFAAEPGDGAIIDRDGLLELIGDHATIDTVTDVLTLRQDTAMSARDATIAGQPQVAASQLKKIVEAILDGDVIEQLGLDPEVAAPLLATMEQVIAQLRENGMDRAQILASLSPDPEPHLARGEIGDFVRIDRSRDTRRKPRFSDTTDELHVNFAAHADVVTVDKNVAHSFKKISGRPVPIAGRSEEAPEEIHILNNGDLGAVVKALRFIAGRRS